MARSTAAQVRARYGDDRSSNRQWREDKAADPASVSTEDQWFEYDGLYQLSEFQRGTLNGTWPAYSGITAVQQDEAWTYDAMGNWLNYTNDALSQTRQFNKVNEITSITGPSGVIMPVYDPVGNMSTLPLVAAWTIGQTLVWEAWNRLVKVSPSRIAWITQPARSLERPPEQCDAQGVGFAQNMNTANHHELYINYNWSCCVFDCSCLRLEARCRK